MGHNTGSENMRSIDCTMNSASTIPFRAARLILAGFICCFVVLLCNATRAQPDSAVELQALLDKCELVDDAECKELIWGFTEIHQDNFLSKAEISRFFRMLARLRKFSIPGQDDAAEVLAFFGGPFAAEIIVANFDYDGDGKLTKEELFFDSSPSDFRSFASSIIETGQSAFILGSVLASRPPRDLRQSGTVRSDREAQTPRSQQPLHSQKISPNQEEPTRHLAKSDIEALRQRISSCIKGPLFSRDGEPYDYILRLHLNPDGSLSAPAEILNEKKLSQKDNYYAAGAKAIRTAVEDCQPFDMLPPDKHDLWRMILLPVRPRVMLGE